MAERLVVPVHVKFIIALMLLPAASCAENNLCGGGSDYCPDVQNSTGELAFVDSFPEQPMVQMDLTCFYLKCCTANRLHVNSTWYKLTPKLEQRWSILNITKEDCDEDEDLCYRYTSDHGQSLLFHSAGVVSDSGKYRCMVTDGRSTISRTFTVQVVQCIDNPDRVIYSSPRDAEASPGSTYTQDCMGNFGCGGAVKNDSLAWWSYIDETGHVENLTNGRHDRYFIRERINMDQIHKASVLTIEGMRTEDFGRTFVCHLKMRDLPTVGFNFSITETGSRTAWRRFIPLIVGLSVSVGVLVIVAVLTCRLCRPRVIYKVMSAASLLPKREPGRFDVMLVTREEAEQEEGESAAEDTKVLRKMEERLRQKRFIVYPSLPSGGRAEKLSDVDRCVTVIFIISTLDLEAAEEGRYLTGFEFYFSNAAGAKTNMIFVSTQPMTKTQWGRLSTEYKNVCPHAPKVCTAVTWPGEGSRSRVERNFWCQIQRFLPKPREVSVSRDDASPMEQARLTDNAVVSSAEV